MRKIFGRFLPIYKLSFSTHLKHQSFIQIEDPKITFHFHFHFHFSLHFTSLTIDLKVSSLVPRYRRFKVLSFARTVPKALKVPSLARSVARALKAEIFFP